MKLFLMVPFTSYALTDGSVDPLYKKQISGLITQLRNKGHEVYCALEYTGWKLGGNTLPEEELRHDFKQIDTSDKIITLLEEKVSAGVQLENGYAFAKDKHFEIYQIGKAAWSNQAFAKIHGGEIMQVKDINEFVAKTLENN